MVSKTSFNSQFWLLTFGLVLVWIVVLSTAASDTHISQKKSLIINDKEARADERNCKSLCKQCGCMGFYCGEECICECNHENSDTECVSRMQNNAQRLKIPFQLLIQGPNSNRFVRNALKYSQDKDTFAQGSIINRNKRSNVVIYKPPAQNSVVTHSEDSCKIVKKEISARQKRSVGQLDWFSDIANTLVRPAPLGGRRRSSSSANSDEVVAQAQSKRPTNKKEMDRSWFAENTNMLLRPAPIFKRQRNQDESENDRTVDNDGSYESPMRAVGKLPKVLKDTLRNLQDTAINGEGVNDLGDTLATHIREGANVLQSGLGDGNYRLFPEGGAIRDNIQQTLSQFFTPNREEELPLPIIEQIAPPKMAPKKKFTWFRPVRFLQRVQQAIN